jgi:PEGA domain
VGATDKGDVDWGAGSRGFGGRMKRLLWLFLIMLTLAPALSFAGDIQVGCEPGLRVYLDGKLVGTSTAKDDGLFLADVPGGLHVIRVEKDGFAPQSFQVDVKKFPIEVKVGAFSPEPTGGETGSGTVKQLQGRLLVTSAPQDCVVEIDGKAVNKSVPVLQIDGVATGEHQISFSKPGYERISAVVTIQPGAEATVRGDLKAGKVETAFEGKGSLRVISTPEHCTVRFLGVTREKIHARLNLTFIPAGEHEIAVFWKNLEVSGKITIINDYRTIVEVSFMKGDKPFVVSYEPE